MTDGVFVDTPLDAGADDSQLDPVVAKRLADKDAYIAQLEREGAEKLEALREKEVELEAARILREAQKSANPPPSFEAKPAAKEPAPSVDPDELVERVIKAQEQRTAEAKAIANAQTVVERLTELYGSEQAANKVVNDRAKALGVGVNFLLDTAKTSPQAFYDLMQLETAPKHSPAPKGDLNAAALKTHAPGVKQGTPEYYEALRKEIGDAAFYTPKIQQQRFKDMQAYHAAR